MGWDPVAVIEGGVIYLIRADHIGRPSFATTLAGTKVWSAVYLPFGGVHVTTGAPIDARFPGQWFQTEAGLYQNWMRDYDPTTGRYIEADPLGLVDGASVYGYAGGNPERYVDPRGEMAGAACAIPGLCPAAVYAIVEGCVAVGIGAYEVYQWWNAPPPVTEMKEKSPPDVGPPNTWVQGPRRGRQFGPDGRPQFDIDKPHQGEPDWHVHEWPGGKREHPGRPVSPWPRPDEGSTE
jgi:RHS repeat-associated protein